MSAGSSHVLSFDRFLGRILGPPPSAEPTLTLRDFYEKEVRPQIEHQSSRSKIEDRTAIMNWELHTGNPDLRSLDREHLVRLRDGMKDAGRAAATINKTWREVKAILEIACEEGVISRVPKIGIRMKSKLLKQPAKLQREIITVEEITRLWHACRFATYPDPDRYPTVKLWRTALLLFWLYGPRTEDLFDLKWESIYSVSKLIKFEAMKTSKLQGLPLVETAAAHIESLRGLDEQFVLAGFRTPGAFLRKGSRWQRGYYTTWRTEITPAAKLGTPIVFKNFRETMLTKHNGVEPFLGDWIAGHYVPGVSAQNYDLPTDRIRNAIESVVIPECFRSVTP